MAKGKKSKGNHYTSKGERKSISRWAKLANRKERRANPTPAQIAQREASIKQIIHSPKNASERITRERLLAKQKVESYAEDLLKSYGEAGLTRAAAIQAVKTDFVPSLKEKWNKKLGEWKQNNTKKDASTNTRIVQS